MRKLTVRLTSTQYYRPFNQAVKSGAAVFWRRFVAREDLPGLTFSHEVSAVYSSRLAGNSIDIDYD